MYAHTVIIAALVLQVAFCLPMPQSRGLKISDDIYKQYENNMDVVDKVLHALKEFQEKIGDRESVEVNIHVVDNNEAGFPSEDFCYFNYYLSIGKC